MQKNLLYPLYISCCFPSRRFFLVREEDRLSEEGIIQGNLAVEMKYLASYETENPARKTCAGMDSLFETGKILFGTGKLESFLEQLIRANRRDKPDIFHLNKSLGSVIESNGSEYIDIDKDILNKALLEWTIVNKKGRKYRALSGAEFNEYMRLLHSWLGAERGVSGVFAYPEVNDVLRDRRKEINERKREIIENLYSQILLEPLGL